MQAKFNFNFFSEVDFIKKLFAVILILSLCCCKSKVSEKICVSDFKSEITLTLSGRSYEGSLMKNGDSLEMAVSGGNLTFPLGFSIENGGFCFSSGKLCYGVSAEDSPTGAIAEIKNLLDSLPLGSIEQESGKTVINAPFGSLKIDEKTGDYLSLSSQSCEVVFKKFEKTAPVIVS